MTLLDRIARETERKAAEIVAAYMEAGLGEKGDWRALEALVTRVHGKPVERVEQASDVVNVRNMTQAERDALMARVLEDHPDLAPLIPRTRRVPGDAQTRMDTG